MTASTEQKPAYLEPTQYTKPSGKCVYEPTLEIGTKVRLLAYTTGNDPERLPSDITLTVQGTTTSRENSDGSPRYQLHYDSHTDSELPHPGITIDGPTAQDNGITDIRHISKPMSQALVCRRSEVGVSTHPLRGRSHSALIGQWIPRPGDRPPAPACPGHAPRRRPSVQPQR